MHPQLSNHSAHRKPYQRARTILIAALIAAPSWAGAGMPADKILDMGLAELRSALDSGAITSAELVGAYLKQIETYDRPADGIHAVLAINEKAMEQATAWDARRAQHGANQRNAPLAGIPFLAKDNFDVAGMPNTGGSLALNGSIPATNAFVVQKLLDQGAILLGKTNMSELAASYGWYGYSSVGGQTLNPFNPLRTADGSSSGSAAAVAAKFAPFALGTDTTGSIRSPASVTGTVGMRTTLGLVSRSGIIPMSLTADVAGAITRTVEDQAIVLDVIQGQDKSDAATEDVARPQESLTTGLGIESLAGKTIAVVDNFDGANHEVDDIKRRSVAAMEKAGARIVHVRLPQVYETLQPALLGPIGAAEFRPQFEAYLAGLPGGQPRDLREFMRRLDGYTDKGTRTINPGRYKGLVENLETGATNSPAYIRMLSVVIPSLRRELVELMAQGRYDALFFPTIGCSAPVVPGKTDPTFVCKSYAYAAAKIASATGFSEITVNGGRSASNIPVGVSFLGKAGDDAKILKIGAAFERIRRSERKH
ncbi:glutamyl-tRNA(Gln) amidotransferase subunit A (plasmid) [Cupriavidus necator N-1]|uniref:Glutamyl-tRNA(Gln) amidotransferase subunit A n=1 Tax=Cupriavidus necator (strain ATCC 43291 / DSM 13513 / CCUG 52238 / LMG 8453 / N-1) TaxID=1042878 RepID=F8GY24_CUPNN|nr:amidase [Cupriavidus necator]AEI83148.1 glutamyl-tRNA(Gln) amidotransferase subunit A [Cupriavidus necator N-1]MDX6008556.1 amidase [Cupriavidus necator]